VGLLAIFRNELALFKFLKKWVVAQWSTKKGGSHGKIRWKPLI